MGNPKLNPKKVQGLRGSPRPLRPSGTPETSRTPKFWGVGWGGVGIGGFGLIPGGLGLGVGPPEITLGWGRTLLGPPD